jgi:Thiolase, N-terminal domain
MTEAVIVSTVRTPVGRGQKGTLTNTRPDDLAALVLKESISRAKIDPALAGIEFLEVIGVACGLAGQRAGRDDQPLLRQRPSNDCDGGAGRAERHERGADRGWRGEHEHGSHVGLSFQREPATGG